MEIGIIVKYKQVNVNIVTVLDHRQNYYILFVI